jgi:hypothetical protein
MAVETAEELAGFFSPDEFGVPMVGYTTDGTIEFNGIKTTGYVGEGGNDATTPTISMVVPRILAKRVDVQTLKQGDTIEFEDGQTVYVNDMHYKGDVVIIHFHEHW